MGSFFQGRAREILFTAIGTWLGTTALEVAGEDAGPTNEETSMKKVYFSVVSGAALLAIASFANAQGTGTGSSSTGAASNQCWDMSSNMVRDKNQTTASGSSTGSTGSTVGAGTSGTASSGSTGSAASGSGSSSTASARPAGMPNC
jgi:hypothetical protein